MLGCSDSHDAGAHRDGAALPDAQPVQIILGLAIKIKGLKFLNEAGLTADSDQEN